MVSPKTDAERRYGAAQSRLDAAEKAARAAEKITAGHPSKIEAKRRRLRDLDNTISHANTDQNSRANRDQKRADIERDIATLERDLREAESALSSARAEIQSARDESSQAGASFTIERDRQLLDDAAAKRETDEERLKLAKQGQELAERKFAQAEKDKLEAAKSQLALAEQQGASTMEIERYRAKAHAANLQFEYQQKREIAEWEAEQRASAVALTNQGNIDLARIQGDLAERASRLSHGQALEVIKANTVADIERAVAHGEVHRKNVTHEVNEDIRKAWEMLAISTQKGISDTLNAAKLLVLKHYLEKDRMTHALKIGQEAKAEELDSVAADMAEIARWNARPKTLQTDFEDDPN